MKWCTVFVNIKFLFDFAVSENLDNVVKAVRINSPKCSFLGLHDGLILRTSLQRKKSDSNMSCYMRIGPLNCGYFLEPVARN